MGAIVLPGFEQQLGPALANLAQTVGRIINPNLEFQLGLRNAISTNPALLQQLADLNLSNPEVFGKLGFGGLGKVLQGVQPSTGAIVQRNVRPAIIAESQKPAAQKVAASQAVTGLTPGQQAEDVFTAERMQSAVDFFRQNKDVTIQDILQGKITPQAAYGLSRSGAGQMLGFQLQNYLNEEDNKVRRELAKAGDTESVEKVLLRAQLNQALRRASDTNVGNIQAWFQHLFGSVPAGLPKPTPQELEAVQVADRRNTAQERVGQLQQDARSISLLEEAINNHQGDDASRQRKITALNLALEQAAQHGAPNLKAVWSTSRPTSVAGIPLPQSFAPNKLTYIDINTGKEYTGDFISEGVQNVTAPSAQTGQKKGPPPDALFSQLYVQFQGNKNKINEELKRQGYDEVP